MKKNIKRIIAFVCIVAVVALLAAMPLLAKQDDQEDGLKVSILSDTVSTGSIHTELIGGGTLAEDDAVTISVPAAVKLKEFLVSNGDAVTEGTAIATVDRVTVMTAISQVQETLEYLSEQIEEASDVDREESVTALAGGIVKILYAEEGESVQSVMLEHGALAVLSLDGLMAVDIVPRKATGAALGVVGMASYVAAGIQDVVSGWLIDGNSTLVETLDEATGQMVQATQYDFTPVAIFWVVASVISFLLPVLNWKYRK